ncbi:carboxymuconolactone decarboxylase family protein [bacterium]|nr:carboxymuconolactone decarboxylase family protein [bacterium]MCB2179018.1 carboxymuconolactone decarboxylase family protein [bacterium]
MNAATGKRLYTPKTVFRFLSDMLTHLDDLRQVRKSGRVSEAFSERIMLAVTQVNGCRYCSYYHSQLALKAGLSDEDVSNLLTGEFGDVPAEEGIALLFAEHYAESAGNPDPVALQRLQQTYGPETSADILALIRTIMVGNVLGNNFDAFQSRLRFKPFPESRFKDEVGVVFGSFVMIPWLLIKNMFRK